MNSGVSLLHMVLLVLLFAIEHTDQRALELIKYRLNVATYVLVCGVRPGRKQTYVLRFSTLHDLNLLVHFLDSNIKLQGHKLIDKHVPTIEYIVEKGLSRML